MAIVWTFLGICVFLWAQRYVLGWLGDRVAKSTFGRKYQIYDVDSVDLEAQKQRERAQSKSSIFVDPAIFAIAISLGFVNIAEASPLHIGATVLFHFVFFEVYFYGLHRLTHHPRLAWIHRDHHLSQQTQTSTIGVFSWLERVLLVAGFVAPFVIVTVMTGECSVWAVWVSLFISDVFNVWGHMNVEWYPRGYQNSWMSRVVASPVVHAMHHARFRGNYGLNTPWMDKLFGTWFEDTERVFYRVKAGQALRSFQERISEKAVYHDPSNMGSTPRLSKSNSKRPAEVA